MKISIAEKARNVVKFNTLELGDLYYHAERESVERAIESQAIFEKVSYDAEWNALNFSNKNTGLLNTRLEADVIPVEIVDVTLREVQ